MFDNKSIYALNKKDPDAIVYAMATEAANTPSYGLTPR